MNTDLLAALGEINLYGFVANDPVNWIDPEGLAKYTITRPEQHPGGKKHVHWGTDAKGRNGGAVNRDGSLRHGSKPPGKVIKEIIKKPGWKAPTSAPLIMFEWQEKLIDYPWLDRDTPFNESGCPNPS